MKTIVFANFDPEKGEYVESGKIQQGEGYFLGSGEGADILRLIQQTPERDEIPGFSAPIVIKDPDVLTIMQSSYGNGDQEANLSDEVEMVNPEIKYTP